MTATSQPAWKSSHSTVWGDASGALCIRVVPEINYSVLLTVKPIFDSNEHTLADVIRDRPALFIADANVAGIYGKLWLEYAVRCQLRVAGELVLRTSEALKAWDQVDGICSYAAHCGLPRNSLIVAIGGGVLLDAAGLASAIFRRGIGYVRIPTTLIGMIDVAVGVKQAVNAHGKKNLMGAFYTPVASINDYSFLQTLPAGKLMYGMAEMIKIALIRDQSLFAIIEGHEKERVFSRFSRPIGIGPKMLLLSEFS